MPEETAKLLAEIYQTIDALDRLALRMKIYAEQKVEEDNAGE